MRIGDSHTRSTDKPRERRQGVVGEAGIDTGSDPDSTVLMVPDHSDILPQTVFALNDVQSEARSLFERPVE
jgi:hypothetical protein